jgi:hypothetical protein
MMRILRYVAMFAVILALFAGVAALADWPVYRKTPRDTAVIMLSFIHGAARADCRRLTPQEIAKLSPNMRHIQDCPRERRSLRVELDIDDKTMFARDLKPSGIAGDGQSKVYERFVAPIGSHDLFVRMRDTARTEGFDYDRRERVTLQPDQMLVIDFSAETGEFLIR